MTNKTTVSGHRPPQQASTLPLGHITVYDVGGVKLESPQRVRPGRQGGGGKRGKIVRWSSHSRARLQRALQTMAPPAGWYTVGATFTIPGPVLPMATVQALWHDFSLFAFKRGIGMIWRAEVQERGALHWHALAIGGPGDYPLFTQGKRCKGFSVTVPEWSETGPTVLGSLLGLYWMDALRQLGPQTYDPPYRGGNGTWENGITHVSDLTALPGAQEYAYDYSGACTPGRARSARPGLPAPGGAWLRYLQDHTSKRKQAQIGENIGRHWGIVGRSLFAEAQPRHQVALTRWDYHRIRRTLARWARPRIRDDRAPFGWRYGWQTAKGTGAGASRWFMPGHLAEKVVAWVRTLPPSAGEIAYRRGIEIERLLRVLRAASVAGSPRRSPGRVVAPFVAPAWFG